MHHYADEVEVGGSHRRCTLTADLVYCAADLSRPTSTYTKNRTLQSTVRFGKDYARRTCADATHYTIHYNTLQYTTIQYTTIHYNTLQYTTIHYNTLQFTTIQCNAMQYNTTLFISNIEHNYTITTMFTQHWDGWKGGWQKNNLIVVHPPTFNIHCQCKIK